MKTAKIGRLGDRREKETTAETVGQFMVECGFSLAENERIMNAAGTTVSSEDSLQDGGDYFISRNVKSGCGADEE